MSIVSSWFRGWIEGMVRLFRKNPLPPQPDPEPPQPDPEPEPPTPEPEKPKYPTIAWNGTTEIRFNPAFDLYRVYIVTHTAKNGKKYDWRTGQYHKLIEMHKPVPSGNVIKIEKIFQIQDEGIIQVCCETMEMYKRDGTKYSWCWLLRPNVPAESWITEAEWRAGKKDGIVLVYGKDG